MKTAAYLRQSLDRDLTKVSVDYQREQLRKLCAAKGWDEPVEYLDRNISATKGSRPAYDDLCRDITGGVVGRVVVWDMDRLHRQPRELEDFIDLAERHGTELANVGGDVDLSTPSGRMFARMKGTVSKYEVEQKSVRQKAANAERAKNGKAWVTRTFGYDGDAIVEREADAIRSASHALLNGASLWSIAAQWNSDGLTSVKGSRWTGGTVRQVLLRARNAGLQVYGGEVLDGVAASWPAIVERDVWESVCTLLADPKRHTGKSPGRKYLLSGIAICGACGKTMGTTVRRLKSGGNRPVYQCKHMGCMRIVRDLAETDRLVVEVITRRLAQPDAVETVGSNQPTVDKAAIKKQMSKLRSQIRQAEADYDDGQITAQRMNARITKANEKLAPLQDRLLGANTSRTLDGLAGAPDAAGRFAALPLDRRRAVIETMARVTIEKQKAGGRFDPAAIRIDWK